MRSLFPALRLIPSALLLLAVPTSVRGQDSSFADRVSGYAHTHEFHGSILVEHRGRVVYERAFGLADRGFRVPMHTTTRFRIASVTKLFTAVMILQLAQEGRLSLRGTIGEYLPTYTGPGRDRVTVEQLLHHTSGLHNPDTVSSFEAAVQHGLDLYQLPHAPEELVGRYASGPLASTPGTAFDYNNADYFILGRIIEAATGVTYVEALTRRILTPLRMTATGMAWHREIIPELAPTYFRQGAGHPITNDLPVYFENWYAAGGLYSTVEDLRRFANGIFGTGLLSDASRKTLLTPGLGDYGCGLWVWDLDINGRAYPVAYRPGRIMGANSALYRVLDEDLTIIILSNTNLTSLDDFAPYIARTLLSEH